MSRLTSTLLKTCSKCNIDKPLSQFYKRKASGDGLSLDCKTCRKQYNHKYIKKIKLHIESHGVSGLKTCSMCNLEKKGDGFFKNNGNKSGLSHQCKACQKEYMNAYRKYNHDSLKIYGKNYRCNNRSKLREKNRKRNHTPTTKERKRNYQSKVRAKKNQQEFVDWPTISEMIDEHTGRCATCERTEEEIPYHTKGYKWSIDHIMPIIMGGGWTRDNAQLLCWECNSRKGGKSPQQWAQENNQSL